MRSSASFQTGLTRSEKPRQDYDAIVLARVERTRNVKRLLALRVAEVAPETGRVLLEEWTC